MVYFENICKWYKDNQVPKNISFETDKTLSTFEICSNDIVKFIRSLDPSKAQGHDGISVCMLQLCATSISKPLQILYKNCFDNECFPQTWKNANIVPIYKKGKAAEKNTINLSHYYLFWKKISKKSYLMHYLNI